MKEAGRESSTSKQRPWEHWNRRDNQRPRLPLIQSSTDATGDLQREAGVLLDGPTHMRSCRLPEDIRELAGPELATDPQLHLHHKVRRPIRDTTRELPDACQPRPICRVYKLWLLLINFWLLGWYSPKPPQSPKINVDIWDQHLFK